MPEPAIAELLEQLVLAVHSDIASDDPADALAVYEARDRINAWFDTSPRSAPAAACTPDDYRAAAQALTDAQALHGDQSKAAGTSRTRALLTPPEFHDRAIELARSIAAQRRGVGRCGIRLDIGGSRGSPLSSVYCELPARHDGWHRHGETEWNDRVRSATSEADLSGWCRTCGHQSALHRDHICAGLARVGPGGPHDGGDYAPCQCTGFVPHEAPDRQEPPD